jgi:ribosomal protein S27AE
MGIFDSWKKDMESKLKKYKEPEKIPQIIKRCPKCLQMTLEYDPETGRIHCRRCGFEEHIPITKEE